MKGNTDKCHLTVNTNEPTEIIVGETKNSTYEKLLGVKIDKTLF